MNSRHYRAWLGALLLELSLASGTVVAAGILVSDPISTPGGHDAYTFTLDIPPQELGTFDTFELVTMGPIHQTPNGSNGEFISGPSNDSGFYANLTSPDALTGLGLMAFGVNAGTDTSHGIRGTFASLGNNGASRRSNVAIAQAVHSAGGGGLFQYRFFDNGVPTASGTGTYGDPSGVMTSAKVVVSGPTPSPSGWDTYTFSLDIPQGEEGRFDALNFRAQGRFSQLASHGGQSAGAPTDLTGLFDFPTSGATETGRDLRSEVSAKYQSVHGASLSEQGSLELGQVVVRPGGGGTFSYEIFRSDFSLGQETVTFGNPTEPPLPGISVSHRTTSPSGLDAYVLSLDIPEGAEGTFDSFEIIARPNNRFDAGLNQDGAGGSGDDSGFFSSLTAPIDSEGAGLTALTADALDTASIVRGRFMSSGDNRASTLGNLDVAQLVMPSLGSGSFSYRFFDDGFEIAAGEGIFGDPSLSPVLPNPPSVPDAGPTEIPVATPGDGITCTWGHLPGVDLLAPQWQYLINEDGTTVIVGIEGGLTSTVHLDIDLSEWDVSDFALATRYSIMTTGLDAEGITGTTFDIHIPEPSACLLLTLTACLAAVRRSRRAS